MIFLKMTASRDYRCNQAYFIPDIPGVGIIVATLGIKTPLRAINIPVLRVCRDYLRHMSGLSIARVGIIHATNQFF
jgi:hypothetical protein